MALVDYGSDNAAGAMFELSRCSFAEIHLPPDPVADSIGDTSEESSASDSQDSYFEKSDSDSSKANKSQHKTAANRLQDHGLDNNAKAQSEQADSGKRDRKTGYAPGEWDITKMAPKLKGQVPPAATGVVSAAPVRYKTDDRVDSNIVTAAQVAMLGGQWASSADTAEEEHRSGPQPAPQGDAKQKRKSTPAMGVQDFLDKGPGGAQLPRKKQDRKDMEKSKRERGQSSHAAWKSEAEMVLRQQYD